MTRLSCVLAPLLTLIVASLVCVSVGACRRESMGSGSAHEPGLDRGTAPIVSNRGAAPLSVTVGDVVHFRGACDASGAVPIDRARFVLADDEDNWLRIYDAERGGTPLETLDASRQLRLNEAHGRPGKGKHGRKARKKLVKKRKLWESDLEAATHLGNEAYWLASHGRNRRGKLKEERLLFFATRVPQPNDELHVVGEPYRDLLYDLISDPRLRPFQLEAASRLPPKAPGGLNLEGLTATPDGELLLGFRSPLYQGRALLVPIRNPAQIPWGQHPSLGEPILLSLDGLGIRGLSWWRGEYLIIAGPPDAGSSRLYAWAGRGHVPRRLVDDFRGLNPEAFFTPEDRDEILLLSDDGMQPVEGVPCKQAPAEAKGFRGLWLTLAGPGSAASQAGAPMASRAQGSRP